jgi:hypothetical protein
VKKNITIIVILSIIFLNICLFSKYSKAYSCTDIIFETDKEKYYTDEIILLNAKWTLEYNSQLEVAYIEILVSNVTTPSQPEEVLWISPIYDDCGTFEKEYIFDIQNFNLTFDYADTIYIQFKTTQGSIGGPYDQEFLKKIELDIFKRNLSCELIGFKRNIILGEILNFTAKFYVHSIENNNLLNNQLISFKIFSDNGIRYQKNYTTNSSGLINLKIFSKTYLILGENILIFGILESEIYNHSIFKFSLFVTFHPEKSPGLNKSHLNNVENPYQLAFFSTISIIFILFIISYIIYQNMIKRVKKQNLGDLTTRF